MNGVSEELGMMMRFKNGNVYSIMLSFWLLSKIIRFKYV